MSIIFEENYKKLYPGKPIPIYERLIITYKTVIGTVLYNDENNIPRELIRIIMLYTGCCFPRSADELEIYISGGNRYDEYTGIISLNNILLYDLPEMMELYVNYHVNNNYMISIEYHKYDYINPYISIGSSRIRVNSVTKRRISKMLIQYMDFNGYKAKKCHEVLNIMYAELGGPIARWIEFTGGCKLCEICRKRLGINSKGEPKLRSIREMSEGKTTCPRCKTQLEKALDITPIPQLSK